MKNETKVGNIFEKGVLVNLTTSVWGGKRKIPSSYLNKQDADPDFISAHKLLVDKGSIEPIEKARGAARSWLQNRSLPFPIKGVLFVPKDTIDRIDEKLQGFQDKFYETVNEFLEKYDAVKLQAKEKLGDLYNPCDYPSDVNSRFDFSWNFFIMDSPDNLSAISPALYARENSKFQLAMKNFEETAMATLRDSFAKIIGNMAEKMTGEGKSGKCKVFRDSLVGNIREFIDEFEYLNVVAEDKKLERLVSIAKAAIDGISAQDLRDNKILRDGLSVSMGEILEELEKGDS